MWGIILWKILTAGPVLRSAPCLWTFILFTQPCVCIYFLVAMSFCCFPVSAFVPCVTHPFQYFLVSTSWVICSTCFLWSGWLACSFVCTVHLSLGKLNTNGLFPLINLLVYLSPCVYVVLCWVVVCVKYMLSVAALVILILFQPAWK